MAELHGVPRSTCRFVNTHSIGTDPRGVDPNNRDVDFGRDVIRIPKSKTIGRVIKIHPALRPWLEAMRQAASSIVQPWPNVGRDLPAACARAGIPRATPNDLRRTFASWLVQAGTSL